MRLVPLCGNHTIVHRAAADSCGASFHVARCGGYFILPAVADKVPSSSKIKGSGGAFFGGMVQSRYALFFVRLQRLGRSHEQGVSRLSARHPLFGSSVCLQSLAKPVVGKQYDLLCFWGKYNINHFFPIVKSKSLRNKRQKVYFPVVQ